MIARPAYIQVRPNVATILKIVQKLEQYSSSSPVKKKILAYTKGHIWLLLLITGGVQAEARKEVEVWCNNDANRKKMARLKKKPITPQQQLLVTSRALL